MTKSLKAAFHRLREAELPQVGMILRDQANHGARLFKVTDVFPSGQCPGMLIEWTDDDRQKRGQAFSTLDWYKRWEVVK
jgi:hypothetical protein